MTYEAPAGPPWPLFLQTLSGTVSCIIRLVAMRMQFAHMARMEVGTQDQRISRKALD